jgi:predicted membrane channel-forming protein YqfA (hemolysin III family)
MSMENPGDKIAPRLRISGALISLGLLIEVFTLSWNNPVAFLVFLGIGGLFLAVGIVFYLLSLVSPSRS